MRHIYFTKCLHLSVATLAFTACETGQLLLEKNAQSHELRNETRVGVPLPPKCQPLMISLPANQTTITVSYQEPTADQKGRPLKELAYTTIYLDSPDAQTRSIRVWTNDAHGGAHVTIHDIPIPADKLKLCVTATNWSGLESFPVNSAPPKP